MAFTTMFKVAPTLTQPGPGTEKKVYNFHHQVRTFAGGGDEVDVMLLQALFRIFYYEFKFFGSIDPPSGTTGIIKVDGIVGKQTRLHIDHFQQFLKRTGRSTTTDGIIDPFRKQGVDSSHTKQPFQLFSLNGLCLGMALRLNREGVHQDLVRAHGPGEGVEGKGPYPAKLIDALNRPPVVMR